MSYDWWWSWLLAGVGVFGLYLAGNKNRAGWAVGVGSQLLWICYATVTAQWGFYVAAVAYGLVYAKNYLAWRRADSSGATSRPRPGPCGAMIDGVGSSPFCTLDAGHAGCHKDQERGTVWRRVDQ